MMKIKVTILFLFLFGLLHSQSTPRKFPNKAADDVFQMIEETEKELAGKKNAIVRFVNLDLLINLSGHEAKFIDGDGIGPIYKVTRKDIAIWKEWYAKNEENFSYYENADIAPELLKLSPIIKVESKSGVYRYSVSGYQLERYRKITAEMKE